MSKARISVAVLVVGLAAAAFFGRHLRALRDASVADDLMDRAQALLTAAPEDAPSLADLRTTDARKLCERAEATSPSPRGRALIELARALDALSLGALDRAQRSLTLAKPALGELALVAVVQAEISRDAHEISEARNVIEHSLQLTKNDARALLLASDLAREAGAGDQALSFAERAVASQPRAAVAYERLGLAHELLGNVPEARADFEKASTLDRRSSTALLHLGRVLRDLGQTRAALLSFRAAAERDPKAAEAWLGSGLCRIDLGDRIGARADFEDALARAETAAEPQLALGDLDVAEGNLASALTRYRRGLELDKTSAAGWVKLGNTLMRLHAGDQAVLAFRSALTQSPDLAQAHNGLGAALLAEGRAPAAEIEFGMAANLDPRDPNPWRNLAVLRKQSGDQQGAASALAEANARGEKMELASLTASGRSAERAIKP